MLNIFSYASWLSVCLLWRNVYLGLLPVFWLGCLFFGYWAALFFLSCLQTSLSALASSCSTQDWSSTRQLSSCPTTFCPGSHGLVSVFSLTVFLFFSIRALQVGFEEVESFVQFEPSVCRKWLLSILTVRSVGVKF